jgi:hypothetical protein
MAVVLRHRYLVGGGGTTKISIVVCKELLSVHVRWYLEGDPGEDVD